MKPTDVRIDKLWLGPGKGNQLRITHLPSGITVLGDPIAISDDPNWFVKEKAPLLEELARKLRENEAD